LVENLNAPTKALIGPWEHRYPHISKIDPADAHSEIIGWFDRWLKGELNGVETLPDFRTFMQEHSDPQSFNKPRKGRWVAEENWPSSNILPQMLYLADGALSQNPSNAEVVVATPADIGAASGYFCAGMRIDNELPKDQAGDDALSCCFDIPLDAALEIMGRPRLKLTLRVDKPVAQIVARLCDVSPEGVSQRVSYRPFNLNHHNGHDAPERLEVGKTYEIEFDLNACAHRFRGGHTLRLALSTSYWPIVWPSPEPVEITLECETSRLTLPVRAVKSESPHANPGPAENFPTLGVEMLREPSATSEQKIIDDRTLTLKTFDDFGKSRDPYHGMINGSHVHMNYEIHPDRPCSARMTSDWSFEFERDEWKVKIDTHSEMTCDAMNFYLHRKLMATEGADETEVLSKEWSKTIPRRLL
jgi:hypothetical protein